MAMDILYGPEIRKALMAGADAVGDTARVTLGPRGRNVVLAQGNGTPIIVNDGAVIAKTIELEGRFENMGASVVKQAASRVEELAGDGTTTSIVLARQILAQGLKNIAAGANPMELRKGLQGASQLACAAIKKLSRPVKTAEDIRQVASLSAGDEELGSLVAEAIERSGPEGVITVEESPELKSRLVVTEGMQYEKGWLHPVFQRNPEQHTEELDKPYLLVTDREITSSLDILPLLEAVRQEGRPLLIIAESVTGEALSTLLANNMQGVLRVAAVHPPLYGDGRVSFMEDICLFTGGTFFSERLGNSLHNAVPAMLGQADKVTIGKNFTAIVNGNGDKTAIAAHLISLRTQIAQEGYGFKRDRLKDRLARFSSGISVLQAGAHTETAKKETKYRLEDALQAAQAAVAEGIVPGGGTTYLDILPAIRAYAASLTGDRKTGASIMLRTLEEPVRQIAENAGRDGSQIVELVKAAGRGIGYNAAKDTLESMELSGVMDPVKVVCLALQCAVSAAVTLLTAEAGLADSGSGDK